MRWLLAVVLVLGGCSTTGRQADGRNGPQADGHGGPPTPSESSASASASPPGTGAGAPVPRVVETIAEGLTSPWGLAFLPDESALVAERDTGLIKRVEPDGTVATVDRVPGVDHGTSEGGLLGLAVHPSFPRENWVYAYFTSATDNRIVRMRYDPAVPGLGRPEVLLAGIPRGVIHNGGRLAFGPDGMLYASTGESGIGDLAPRPDSLGGKILRLTPGGAPAPGNPTPGSPVWSLGHRNVQGLAWNPTGQLFASEFGQSTWDELNHIRPGRNYGWPTVEGRADVDRFVDPLAQWRPDVASPSGIAHAAGAVWMAALAGERLWRIRLDGTAVRGSPTAFLAGRYGRLRTVAVAPDGSLWLTTSNTDGRGDPAPGDDRILRLSLD